VHAFARFNVTPVTWMLAEFARWPVPGKRIEELHKLDRGLLAKWHDWPYESSDRSYHRPQWKAVKRRIAMW
jgi:hypothetical protein